MSDNKLLAENTIRRFMKLANTEVLSDNFISENTTEEIEEANEEVVNEEETTELEENTEDLEEQEDEEEMEMDMEMGDMNPEPEADAAPEMAEADMSLTEEEARLIVSLGERLKAAMDAEADDEPELEDEEPEAPEEEIPEMEDDEPAKAYGMEESQEDLVNEVLKRVTKRLVAEKLKNRK